MNNFKRVSAAVVAGMALLIASGASHGLGFGLPSSRPVLGETLVVSVPVRLDSGEEFTSECLGADVYFGDDKVAASAIQAVLLPGSGADRVIKVSTTALINEPVVTFYVAAGCKARITRKFIAFANPPGMVLPGVDGSSATAVAQPEAVSSPEVVARTLPASRAPSVAGAERSSSRRNRTSQARRSGGGATARQTPPSALQGATSLALSASQPDGALSGKSRSRRKTEQAPPVATANANAGRLVLDPAEADATVIPSLRMATALAASGMVDDQSPQARERREAAAALWQAMNASPEDLARDRLRLQDLEQRLARLKQEGERARQAVAQIEARAQEAEAHRFSPTLVYGLAALALCSVGALGALLWKRRREQDEAAWWEQQGAMDDPESTIESEPPPADELEPPFGPQFGGTRAMPHLAVETGAETQPAALLTTMQMPAVRAVSLPTIQPPSAAPPARPPVAPAAMLKPEQPEPLREVSVEELIDLEQQAEFFVVLGQDDAAIDLLEGHVQSTTGASPLPFLKLLEIYQRLGQRQDYERIQAQFNQRFNGYAPAWESDLQQGHSLVDYPGVIERLQTIWGAPAKAMDVLEVSLTRPDDEAETFDLPAYRELLFLYAVARDLSEREALHRPAVDLLLPVTDISGAEPSISVNDADNPIEPLMATRPVKADPNASPSLALDLHLDDLIAPSEDPGSELLAQPQHAGLTDNHVVSPGTNEIEFEHIDLPATPVRHKP